MNSNNDLLKMALSRMEGSFSQVTLSAWFDDAEAVSLEGTSFVLRAANQFKKEIIESRFTTPLQQALTELLGEPITVTVVYGDQPAAPIQAGESIGLSPDEEYTFEHFIVGSSNKFAHAAAVSVANHPAENYNPLFIYGQSGLGKTHLLHAIGNVIRGTIPISASSMSRARTSQTSWSPHPGGRRAVLRGKYRMADLLLIDDIQFIAGKERTQEEFFHTFNALNTRSSVRSC